MEHPAGDYVLVVDDTAVFRQILCRAIELDHFKTVAATNGAEALKVMRQLSPRLIVLDLIMPVLDGWELLQAVRADPNTAAIPVIVLSATTDADVATRALALGASKVFFKTEFTIKEFRQWIRERLNG